MEPLTVAAPNVIEPLLALNVPSFIKLPSIPILVECAVSVPEMVTLFNVVVEEPSMVVVPLNVVVPLLCVYVPLLTQLLAIFIFAEGPVSAPDMVMLLKVFVLEPLIAVVPLNVTVPLLCVNDPSLIQLPATFMFADEGPVSVPEMLRLLNELVVDPLMLVVPLNVTVPLLCVNVPLFTQLRATFIFAEDPISVPEIVML